MLIYWIWLATRQGMTAWEKQVVLSYFGNPEDCYFAKEAAYKNIEELSQGAVEALCDKNIEESEAILASCAKKKVHILTWKDLRYPVALKNISDPPMILYYRGTLPEFNDHPFIGVVGTRKASAYGMKLAETVGKQLTQCGGIVVSGMAEGIDAMATRGALSQGKMVVGVLGCGVDVVYPKSNQTLFERVLECGCILSEFAPGTAGMSWNFPRRNRIISGLSDGVLVVEAPEKSGALITAACAVEQGRDVFVTPGNIDVESFVGSNNLLRRGGIAVFSGWDVAREYENRYPGTLRQGRFAVSQRQDTEAVEPKKEEKIQPQAVKKEKTDKKVIDNGADSSYSVSEKTLTALSQQEKSVLALVTGESVAVDEIIAQSGLPMGAVLSSLTMLAMKGIVQNLPGRRVSLKK